MRTPWVGCKPAASSARAALARERKRRGESGLLLCRLRAFLQRLRGFEVLLQSRQRLLCERRGRLILALGFLLECSDILLVVRDHMLCERLVERGAVELAHFVVVFFLFRIGFGRRGHIE